MSRGTTKRNIRIDDKLWQAALAKAREQGRTVSDVVRELLSKWIREGNEE